MKKRTNTPLLWLPFAAGGQIIAVLFPALIWITGRAIPFGCIRDDINLFEISKMALSHPLGGLIALGLIIPPIWHGAHRFRLVCQDLGAWTKTSRTIAMAFCYGSAIFLTVSVVALIIKIGGWI